MGTGAHKWLWLFDWFKNQFTIDIREPSTEDLPPIYTDDVAHTREPGVTTDVCLDDMTCVPTYPEISDTILITPGKLHWYGYMIENNEVLTSPPISMYIGTDCDPAPIEDYRWALLCIYRDLTGENQLHWEYSERYHQFPQVPHNMVPLCYVKQNARKILIDGSAIFNWRTIHPANAPSTQFLYPPVNKPDDLYTEHTNVPEGAVSFVVSEGMWYFYSKGRWSPQSTGSFDNTLYTRDVAQIESTTPLPWAIYTYPEVAVFRDGFLMTPGVDKDYTLQFGPSSAIIWNQTLYPNMRITVLRNPFVGASYAPDTSVDDFETYNLYVNGIDGNDAFPGTEENPFKTLQRAFNTIPLSSKHAYTVHVQKLQLADRITYQQPDTTTYGLLRNCRVRSLQVIVEPNCEYDATFIDYLYVMERVTMLDHTDHTVHYPFALHDCMASFYSTIFESVQVLLDGGSYLLFKATQNGGTIAGDSLAYIRAVECTLTDIYSRTCGNFQIYNSEVKSARTATQGMLNFDLCRVTTVQAQNGAVVFNDCAILGRGSYISSHVVVTNSRAIGAILSRIAIPFELQFNSTIHWINSEIAYPTSSGIILRHGSTGDIRGGKLTNSFRDAAILVEHGSSLYFESVELSNNEVNGILLNRGSYGHGLNATGNLNTEWGIRAKMYSSCLLDNVTTSGMLGVYMEDQPGSNSVAADGSDQHPSNLEQKTVAGMGIRLTALPQEPPVGNRRLEISLNIEDFTRPDSPLASIVDTKPRATVFRYLDSIVPGGMINVSTRFTGIGFLSSVAQRINNPSTQILQVLTNIAHSMFFIQWDSSIGTNFVDDGWCLIDRPGGIGYPIRSPYYMYSIARSQSSLPAFALSEIHRLAIEADTPPGTSVKCGISIDGGRSFKRYDGLNWVNLPGESPSTQLNNAPTYTDVNAYPLIAWNSLKMGFAPEMIDVGFSIMTTDPTYTPKVRSYTWEYAEDGFNLDISEKFQKMFYPSRASFRNISSETIQPPVIFTIYPLNNYEVEE